MHSPLAPLLSALLALAAPPPSSQLSTTRSAGDNTVSEVGGKNFRQWTDDLKNPDASVREEAIRALVLFGREAARAVPQIVERLQDTDSSPRVKAAIALGVIDIRKEDVEKVAKALGQHVAQDSSSVVRYYAASSLVNLGEDARYALPSLAQGVHDNATWEIRHACVASLREAGRVTGAGPSPVAIRALIAALIDPTYRVRLEAILAIGALGKPDDPTLALNLIKTLQGRLVDRDAAVKIWAHAALMIIDEGADKSSLQSVIKFLKNTDPKVRVEAARALTAIAGKMKSKQAAIEPALLTALSDKEVTVIAAAAKGLAEMGELSGPGRAALLDLLKNPDPPVRVAGAQSFGSVGIRARAAVPALTDLVQDKEQPPVVTASACWALGEIGDPASAAVLKAVGERKDVDESLKQVAQSALDQLNKVKR